jgi:hypothetical protein
MCAGQAVVTLDNYRMIGWPRAADSSAKCLPYQLSMVGYMPTMVVTGNGEQARKLPNINTMR